MSKLFVDEIVHQSSQGSGTITLGASGETVALASGASQTMAVNTPAFEAYDESFQSVSDETYTKLDVATENFDTNNNFDNSTMRFTPTVAGKYFFYAKSDCDATGYEDLRDAHVAFYKNGSILTYTNARFFQGGNTSSGGTVATPFTSAVLTLNGSSDYVEVYVKINSQDGSNGSATNSIFGGYKIIE